MSKILFLEQDRYLGDDLSFFFDEGGHSIDWRNTPDKIRDAYTNIPDYDVAVVDKTCDERIPEFTCDDLVKKLKQTSPSKKVICLTAGDDICKYADKNLGIITEAVLNELLREVKV